MNYLERGCCLKVEGEAGSWKVEKGMKSSERKTVHPCGPPTESVGDRAVYPPLLGQAGPSPLPSLYKIGNKYIKTTMRNLE